MTWAKLAYVIVLAIKFAFRSGVTRYNVFSSEVMGGYAQRVLFHGQPAARI